MGRDYLVCRHGRSRVLVASSEVLGVREVELLAPPPAAPSWIAGIAFTDDAAVVVAAPGDSSRGGVDLEPVVLLRPIGDESTLCGIAVDGVVELRTLDVETKPARDAARPWLLSSSGDEAAVVVDVGALRAHLSRGVNP